jgi:hypothetical protein
MKFISFIVLFFGLSFAGIAQDVQSYGAEIKSENAISVTELSDKLSSEDELEARVEGIINASCAAKGCWMTMQLANGEEMRVKFKDYGFFVPTKGLNGKKAVVDGVAKREVTSVATLKHYAEDAGKSEDEISKITEPLEEVTFVANGVLIFD